MNEQVKLSVFYPYPPEKVWLALTDCRILNAWMMKNDFEPRLGHKFKFESNSLPGITTIIHCEVLELTKPKRLTYTWQDNVTGEPSLVIWTLTSVEGGTQLQLKHQPRYATALIRNQNKALKNRSGLFLSQQPVANCDRQIPETSLFLLTARDELNSLLNPRDFKEQWDYRLNRKLPQALQQHIWKPVTKDSQ
ncbi:SRPBCC domain-containing protein [Pleurocapsales cyanobacterium LEGE 10410]|nr:SRPBCC domain-containing protein [Pleurocapsales cyanobacterium LEGE 10410]